MNKGRNTPDIESTWAFKPPLTQSRDWHHILGGSRQRQSSPGSQLPRPDGHWGPDLQHNPFSTKSPLSLAHLIPTCMRLPPSFPMCWVGLLPPMHPWSQPTATTHILDWHILDCHISAPQASASSLELLCLSQAVDTVKRHENQDCFHNISPTLQCTAVTPVTCMALISVHSPVNAAEQSNSRKPCSYCISSQLLHTWTAAFAWDLDTAYSGFGSFRIAPGNNCCHEQILCLYTSFLFFPICPQTAVHPQLHRPQATKLTAVATADNKAVRLSLEEVAASATLKVCHE